MIFSKPRLTVREKISLICMSLLYIAGGINHFVNPLFYERIMPEFIPWHKLLNLITGIIEIGLGILLLPLLTRRFAAWGIIILLVAVFPANINMMLNYLKEDHPSLWITIVRLPLQLALIGWAYTFTKKAATQV